MLFASVGYMVKYTKGIIKKKIPYYSYGSYKI